MLNLNFQNGQAPALNARNMNAIVESINTLGYAVGGPNVASTVSAMTDTSKVYVYTGSETGYTAGNWYYYNGSAWVSGGVYQAAAVETDTTLTMPGEPADAKATGDAIADLKSDLSNAINHLGIYDKTFTYTASSGYQNQPCELSAGDYLVTVTGTTVNPMLRDENNNNVIILNASWENHLLTVTEEQADLIALIRMYQGTAHIVSAVERISVIENEVETSDNKIAELTYKTGLYNEIFTYTASSGYQKIPIKLFAGNYLVKTISGNYASELIDINRNAISTVQALWTDDHLITITEEQAEQIVAIKLYQSSVSIKALQTRPVFYCGASRELSTLKAGVEEATKYMDATLYVDDGIYDLVQEFGNEYFENLTNANTFAGLMLGNRIRIVFSPNSKVISHYTGNNVYALTHYSPFNVKKYGFTLENLTLECSRCRYCVHDERSGGTELCQTRYINCSMYIDNHDNAEWLNKETSIGGGLGSNHEVIVENCVFDNYGDSYGGVYYHQSNDTANPDYRGVVTIKDNYFVKGTVFVSCSRTDMTLPARFVVCNNSIPKVYSGASPDGIYRTIADGALIDIRAWNNEIRTA